MFAHASLQLSKFGLEIEPEFLLPNKLTREVLFSPSSNLSDHLANSTQCWGDNGRASFAFGITPQTHAHSPHKSVKNESNLETCQAALIARLVLFLALWPHFIQESSFKKKV